MGQDEWDELAEHKLHDCGTTPTWLQYAVGSTDLKEQGCNKLEKKRDALAAPGSLALTGNSAPSGLSGYSLELSILNILLAMSETVMNGSVEAYLTTALFRRRAFFAISGSACFALSEATHCIDGRGAELSSGWHHPSSFKLG